MKSMITQIVMVGAIWLPVTSAYAECELAARSAAREFSLTSAELKVAKVTCPTNFGIEALEPSAGVRVVLKCRAAGESTATTFQVKFDNPAACTGAHVELVNAKSESLIELDCASLSDDAIAEFKFNASPEVRTEMSKECASQAFYWSEIADIGSLAIEELNLRGKQAKAALAGVKLLTR